jgi:hypothetical protein
MKDVLHLLFWCVMAILCVGFWALVFYIPIHLVMKL